MKSITFTTGEFKEEKTSAWLMAFLKAAESTQVFSLLDGVTIKLKKVNYSIRDKLSTLICSIAMGCAYTSDVNDKLVPDTIASRMLGMERFPDQSQLNVLLRRISADNIKELKNIHHQLFLENSTCLASKKPIVVDIDQSGVIANGKNFELAEKGYFPRKRNNRGYQVSAAFCGDTGETLSMYLDPGNVHSQTRLKDILNDILAKVPSSSLILRMDSAYGSLENISVLKATKARFVVKGFSSKQSKNLAADILKSDWVEIDSCIDIYELPSRDDDALRVILVRTLQKDGSFKYTHLLLIYQQRKCQHRISFTFTTKGRP